jgi:hypothetical protein
MAKRMKTKQCAWIALVRYAILASLPVLFISIGHSQLKPSEAGDLSGAPMEMSLPEVPQPGIRLSLTNTNQVLITITNGVSFANYELYHRPALDAAHPWRLSQVGLQAQSNFVAGMSYDYEFFVVAVGSDWDSDGVFNAVDADAMDATVGILSVTVESPANGSVVQ